MTSQRLTYRPVSPALLDEFHRLVQDEHVRRFLMDGTLFPREWSVARAQDSECLFERRGVGIWLTFERQTGCLVGFCGFLELPSAQTEPQLVYALFERFTGAGYATEMAAAAVEHARRQPAFERIIASVDEENVASKRVLEKLGFRPVAVEQGSLGDIVVFAFDAADAVAKREGPAGGGSR